jgi:2-iminobutanoate/2-iminopropanoate deaminase
MRPQSVFSPAAPAPIGPYSQAVWCGDQLFLSGQIPIDSQSGAVVGVTITEQARQAIGNCIALLASQGLDTGALVKTTVFLADMTLFAEFNAVYEELLGIARPARSVVGVAALPKNVLVEIEAVACR